MYDYRIAMYDYLIVMWDFIGFIYRIILSHDWLIIDQSNTKKNHQSLNIKNDIKYKTIIESYHSKI